MFRDFLLLRLTETTNVLNFVLDIFCDDNSDREGLFLSFWEVLLDLDHDSGLKWDDHLVEEIFISRGV